MNQIFTWVHASMNPNQQVVFVKVKLNLPIDTPQTPQLSNRTTRKQKKTFLPGTLAKSAKPRTTLSQDPQGQRYTPPHQTQPQQPSNIQGNIRVKKDIFQVIFEDSNRRSISYFRKDAIPDLCSIETDGVNHTVECSLAR